MGLLVVNVSVTAPAVLSAAEGVYVALSVVAFGEKVPVPLVVHVALVAVPPMEPASVTADPAQIV